MNNQTFVINIGRQLGSGGRQIGKKIAEDVGIRFLDKELIYLAAKDCGFSPELFEQNDEQKGKLRSFLTNFIPFVGNGDIYGSSVSEESLFSILSQTIRRIAEEESCVIIGRCSEYILRDKPECVNVFISANESDRILRIAKQKSVTPHVAEKIIRHSDSRRASFHDFYSSGAWGDATTYHLCINSSVLGIDGTTEFIKEFANRKLGR